MTAAFRPEAYKDEYRERLAEAIEDKAAGKAIAGKKTKAPGKVTDLMDALRKSVEQSGRGRPAKKASAQTGKVTASYGYRTGYGSNRFFAERSGFYLLFGAGYCIMRDIFRRMRT